MLNFIHFFEYIVALLTQPKTSEFIYFSTFFSIFIYFYTIVFILVHNERDRTNRKSTLFERPICNDIINRSKYGFCYIDLTSSSSTLIRES